MALVVLALLPALGLMLYSSQEQKKRDTENVNHSALRLSRFIASSLERDIQGAQAFLTALSRERQWFAPGATACSELLHAFHGRGGPYDAIGIADGKGEVLCQVPAPSGLVRLDTTPWFQSAQRSLQFTVGYGFDRMLIDKVTMDFGLPVSGPGGRLEAFYFCAMDLEWLNRVVDRVQLPSGAALTVTDRQGRALVRYPHPELWVGKNFPDAPLSRSVLTREEGVVESQGMDGVFRLYAFSKGADGALSVRIGIPRETAYAAAHAAMVRNLAGLGIAALVSLLAAWVIGQWMVGRQVDKLVAATRRVAAGNLEARTEMDYGGGELGQLARAFDEMAESLQWRQAQLRESEMERSHSEGRFTEMVEMASDAIIGVRGNYSVFFFNRGAERIFGYRREEVEGRDLRNLEVSGDAAPSRNAPSEWTRHLLETRKERAEWRARRKDGSVFTAEVSLARIDRNGDLSYTLIVRERPEKSAASGAA